ncbi:MAG: hypothetical protein ABSF08_02815 [Candidatus Cybelea sp.]
MLCILGDRQRRDDGEKSRTQKSLDQSRLYGGDFTDVAEIGAARNARGSRDQRSPVDAAHAGGRNPKRQQRADDSLVDRAAEDGLGDFERRSIGDAQAVHAGRHHAAGRQRRVDLRAASVHQNDRLPGLPERRDLGQERVGRALAGHLGGASHGVAAVFHDRHRGGCIIMRHVYKYTERVCGSASPFASWVAQRPPSAPGF